MSNLCPRWLRHCFHVGALVLVMTAQGPAFARSGGIDGYSGDPSTNGGAVCNACHGGGSAPTVVLDGPTVVLPGEVNTYTLRITGGQGIAGGLGVSATDGALQVTDPGTYLRNDEITHNSPRNVDGTGAVTFSFNWQAPLSEGSAILYGAGNSVNLANGNNGDMAAGDVLVIDVAAASATPGETAGPGVAPLLVTGYDQATGNLSLTYGVSCETIDNNIYFGPLEQVGSHAWSGEDCAIGAGGAHAGFNPGPGSYFFVIVGNKGADEGSYGTTDIGAPAERPPYPANTCGQLQTLGDRCD